MRYPLNQDFISAYDEFFVYGKNENDIILVYLILILLTSVQYFLRGFFLFILAVVVEFIFNMMRMMQKSGWGSSPVEKEYWDQNGWLGKKRPWNKL